MNITSEVTKMLESLLKLKVQMSLAKGDYDAVKLYADQLSLLDQGMLIRDLPIGEELFELMELHNAWLDERVSSILFISELRKFYGEDLYKVCVDFMLKFGDAVFQVLVSE